MPKSQSKSKSKSKPKSKSKSKSNAKSKSARKPAKPKPPKLTASSADKYQLYQWSVQAPENDIPWFLDLYRRRNGSLPKHLREDFSGTGLLSCTWADRGKRYSAESYDIDPEPVGWGETHNRAPLGDAAGRVQFYLEDARTPSRQQPDVRVALNFSYFIFKQRDELLGYFRAVREDLGPQSLFVLDIYGGPDALHETEELRDIEQGFTYVWEQDEYWPSTGDYLTHIHFRFRDGSEMEKAFTYDWRLWGLPEIVDLLKEAGFGKVETYWEGTDEDTGGGNGEYSKSEVGENCLAWVTYVVCSAD